MKLTDTQREDLKNLASHPGFQVLKEIKEDSLKNLAKLLLESSDLENENDRRVLKNNQNYAQAMNDIINQIETNSLTIVTPNV